VGAGHATVFPADADPASLIADVLASGVVPLHPRRAEGFVRTPDALADDICDYPYTDLRWLPAGSAVLEPSAGDGSLVAAILRANPDVTVTAVEPNPSRAAACATVSAAVTVHTGTFEDFAAAAIRGRVRFAAVVMNPPYAVPGDPAIWIEHLRLAWHLLAPGATLVAIVPAGFLNATGDRLRSVAQFIDHHGGSEPLPAGSFRTAGTDIHTRIVRLTRPVGTGPADHLLAARTGTPVRVDEPRLTGEAVAGAPVQVWRDAWRSRDRVLRFHGRCVLCGWLLWGFDDGQNDPRGVLGDFTVGFSLTAADYDRSGPDIGLCCRCGNDGDRYRAGFDAAYIQWASAAMAVDASGLVVVGVAG